MALTITVVNRSVVGNHREVTLDILGDSSYVTGGEAVTAAQSGAIQGVPTPVTASLAFCKIALSETNAAGYRVCFDTTNTKILFFDVDSEAPNTTDLSAVTVRCMVRYDFPTG